MEKFLKKNLKLIAIILFFLFMIKSFQSCIRKASMKRMEKNLIAKCDTITKKQNHIIDSLSKEISTKDYIIRDLTFELKLAGVKVDEAQKRAEAIENTASKIKANTTIKIETQDKK
ncbi:MAG: hypothetical protein PHF86_00620 [Candidatus Nanoarchaeia archaeon]|nr:hypothetical protein [Candidatus Nanoarchaeia archaeon]